MTFDEWWKLRWPIGAAPASLNDAFREIASDAWIVAGVQRTEECAALCEGLCINLPDDPLSNSFDGGCRTSAKAIRARGEKV